jgi:hypothetical protein
MAIPVLLMSGSFAIVVIVLFQFLGPDATITPFQERLFPVLLLAAALSLSTLGLTLVARNRWPLRAVILAILIDGVVAAFAFLLMKLLQTAGV